jgi:hypothetical protein
VLPAMGGVLAAPVAPSGLEAPDVVAGGDAAGGGHDVRARNAAALPAGGADMPGAAVPRAVASVDAAIAVAGAAALTVVVGLLAVTGDLLALCAAAGAVLAAGVEVTPPAAAGADSTGGGWVLRMTRAPSVSGIPAGASLTT